MTENTITPTEEVTVDIAVEEIPQVDPTGRTGDAAANGFYWGTGRRKNAVARVRIRPGKGEVVVNGKPLDVYFDRAVEGVRLDVQQVRVPLQVRRESRRSHEPGLH